jgi:hypothetical protein
MFRANEDFSILRVNLGRDRTRWKKQSGYVKHGKLNELCDKWSGCFNLHDPRPAL